MSCPEIGLQILSELNSKKMKIAKHYPDDFKLKVVRHYLESDEGYKRTSERFDLSNGSLVMKWVRKFGCKLPVLPEMSKPAKREKTGRSG